MPRHKLEFDLRDAEIARWYGAEPDGSVQVAILTDTMSLTLYLGPEAVRQIKHEMRERGDR